MKKHRRHSNGPLIALIAGVVVLVALVIYQVVRTEGLTRKINQHGCISTPIVQMEGLERDVCKAPPQHVADETQVTYSTDPPLWGDHWNGAAAPGYYEEPLPEERLVHSLEHGNVVLYYDKSKLSAAELEAVKALTLKYKDPWSAVIAVPRTDAKHAVILTAWEVALRLEKYDAGRVDKFVDAYRGKGPENPVR
jgi:hypothetical protein